MPTLLTALLFAWLSPGSSSTRQTLVVTSDGWSANEGRAVLVEDGHVVLGPVRVFLGDAGLGWAVGSDKRGPLPKGPDKREGDRRSPAGVFTLGPIWTWPWRTRAVCVDDAASADYGRVFIPSGPPSWKSAEQMSDYRVAVVVGHNAGATPGAGSCIFLHDGAQSTVGCTAFAPSDLDALAARLHAGATLVQLPRAVYKALAERWQLPAPHVVAHASALD